MTLGRTAAAALVTLAAFVLTTAPATGQGDQRFTLSHAGLQRAYLVHVPKTYTAARPAPLVLALHGGGGNMTYQANDDRYSLISKSEAAGFVAVFPNGYSRLPGGRLATWNTGACCGASRDRNIDDVGFLKAVIERVSRDFAIDRARVYSIGMSNGGLMAYRLACELSGTIAGIMAVAGTDNTSSCQPTSPVRVLHVHAADDDHVLFNGGAGPAARNASAITSFTSVPATVAKWRTLNRTAASPRRVLDVPGAYCDLYPAERGGAPVQLCVTETGGHSWPGGRKPRAGESTSKALSANDIMWDFFSRQ